MTQHYLILVKGETQEAPLPTACADVYEIIGEASKFDDLTIEDMQVLCLDMDDNTIEDVTSECLKAYAYHVEARTGEWPEWLQDLDGRE